MPKTTKRTQELSESSEELSSANEVTVEDSSSSESVEVKTAPKTARGKKAAVIEEDSESSSEELQTTKTRAAKPSADVESDSESTDPQKSESDSEDILLQST